MGNIGFIQEDFVKTYAEAKKSSNKKMNLAFGDKVEILEFKRGWTKLRCLDSYDDSTKFVRGKLDLAESGVLKISMVDVQQGDGMIIESPKGKVVFVDGGDNKLFARHAAARYQHKKTTDSNRMDVEAIIITHGDADHFDGLNEIVKSEKNKTARKRLFIHPKRIFHNGLVKKPSKVNGKSVPAKERFGTTAHKNGKLYAVDLYEDTRNAKDQDTNTPFKRWHKAVDHWEQKSGKPVGFKRIAHGMDEHDLFDFLEEEDINMELLGPFTDNIEVNGALRPALPFLHKHPDGSMIHLESDDEGSHQISASHTINGHSIAFRLSFGNVRVLFTGDLNKEALDIMTKKIDTSKLACEVFKAPHHGSHDFAVQALKKAAPIVSIVSSGDEHAGKEHIHPRATLMAALGNSSRTDMSIIFSTELAAFFRYRKECYTRDSLAKFFKESTQETYTSDELRKLFSGVPKRNVDPPGMFFGFERTNFGIIHIRTDGKRLLVFTHSGKKGLNEAYSYTIDENHNVTSNNIIKK
ncbi:MBL fold metallo-hydrolase [Muricauda sp. SCSIO 64092]|uniref:ComEC/Rec2 family competence protein n=1 Tax=Allomuricauda sp. SCSIO 64092 TaxID=2908842 RepID=UPI001FF1E059|nr:MBL fold metallo-hydrolase [Muricauda sp. SCSIO 64092]UOY06934.1 MBL fold metallo-hydrolase [Muricauda sp. SCSIO 64092]